MTLCGARDILRRYWLKWWDCFLRAPSHCLCHCRLFVNEGFNHWSILQKVIKISTLIFLFENVLLDIMSSFSRCQWFKTRFGLIVNTFASSKDSTIVKRRSDMLSRHNFITVGFISNAKNLKYMSLDSPYLLRTSLIVDKCELYICFRV